MPLPDTARSPDADPASPVEQNVEPATPVWRLLASTALLYAAFGLIYGLMQGGLPPLMRARGVDLAAIGWTFVVLVPFGLTFLWAPFVDAVRPFRTAPLIGWIVLMQLVIVAMLLVVARNETAAPAVLLSLGVVIAFAAATMDVALDALATVSVPSRHRTTAGGLKVAALAVGAIMGGGVFVATAGQLGWTATFDTCAALSALAIVPILFVRAPAKAIDATTSGRPDLLAILRRGETRRRMAVLTLATCTMVAPSFFNRVLLVDLGVSLDRIGWIVGTGAPLCGLLASLVAIPLLRRVGARTGIVLCAGFCILAIVVLGVSAWQRAPILGMTGAIAMNAGTSGFFVILCATTLGWAQGSQPATDYAVLYGASRLCATLLLIALARLIAVIGWTAFYASAAIALLLTMSLLRRVLPELREGVGREPTPPRHLPPEEA